MTQLRLNGGYPALLGIHATETTKTLPLGTRGVADDGRVFYYASADGAALNAGQVYVRRERVPNHTGLATATDCLVLGAREAADITLGATALTADDYADGFVSVESNGGHSSMLKIAGGHDSASASATVTIPLAEEVHTASDASTTVSLIHNPYRAPQISNTDQADVLVGIPVVDIADGSFGWIQTWGEASVLADETVSAVGQALVIGTGTAGAVEEDDTATTVSQEPIVGWNIEPLADGEYNAVYLTIRP
jgi:hypothetical protein